jgi:hypothetical protein
MKIKRKRNTEREQKTNIPTEGNRETRSAD